MPELRQELQCSHGPFNTLAEPDQAKINGPLSIPDTMSDTMQAPDDELSDFESRSITINDETRSVYVAGHGPAVVVMPEIPGITPDVARFARWVREAGFTVWMPSLFGKDGGAPSPELVGEAIGSLCVRREFEAFARNDPSPMTQWLRQLAAQAHMESGGPGVGAIGMCFTGNFALSMMLEESMIAPVMSQPSLPLDDPAGTFINDEDMVAIKSRLDRDDLTVRAYRFEGDGYCQAARFAALEEALGERFEATVIPDTAAGNLGWIGTAHSVVTTSLIDEEGQPTAQARDEILEFLASRLRPE
jgi:dienelactone hydrolase